MLLGRLIPYLDCASARVCIEIDGDTHTEPEQAEYDRARTEWLDERGLRAIRFTNTEVTEDLPAVLRAIQAAGRAPSGHPTAGIRNRE